jgi:MFS family permease
MIGIIIGTSSIAGALFDFVACRIFKKANFRRIFMTMFLLSALCPLILWQAKSFWIYVVAMAIWGMYFDLYNFGKLSFVSNCTDKEQHASSSGVLEVFRCFGYLLAPIIAGFAIGEAVGWRSFTQAYIFLGLAFIFFIVLLRLTRKNTGGAAAMGQRESFETKKEYRLWCKTVILLKPVLIMMLLVCIYDAFFWTIGPLFAESSLAGLDGFQGMFMTAYELPALIVGWFIGDVTSKFGKKQTAFVAFIIGSLLLATMPLMQSPYFMIGTVFFASMFLSMAAPSINGAYADYADEAPNAEKEIEAVSDLANNIGYIIGPIAAGVLADIFGNSVAFSILSALGIVVTLILIKITPKEVNVSSLEKLAKKHSV